MRTLAFVLFLLVFTRCSGPSGGPGPDQDGQTVHAAAEPFTNPGKPIPLGGCYEMVLNRDTALLRMAVQDSTVNGNLDYRWYRKDRNNGRFTGIIRDSLIYADYTFESEGSSSVREVIFRIKDSTLQWASGELVQKEGKVVFTEPASVHFDSIAPFFKIPCRE
jgi:hypothetical protein